MTRYVKRRRRPAIKEAPKLKPPPDINVYMDGLGTKLLKILDPDYDAKRVNDLDQLAACAAVEGGSLRPAVRKEFCAALELVGDRFLKYAEKFR